MRTEETMQELAEAIARIPINQIRELNFLVRLERARQLPFHDENIRLMIAQHESERNDPRLRRIRLRNGILRQ